ncbi:MAG: T9SS type A sorting domain-containing protein [Bacteroidetes bacterium]|nr:T9SS type A sorting domain-containing protein [Bacteroidota bacterium]
MNRFIQLLFSAVLITIVSFTAQAQQYRWVTGGGSACTGSIYRLLDKITHLTTDAHGNIYVLASIGDDNIVADTFSLTRGYAGVHCDQQLLFASYNCNGNMRFAKFINGYSYAMARNIAYDGKGNIYLAGIIGGSGGSIGTGPKRFFGTDTVVNTENYNSFLIKYDTSGKMKWLKFLGVDSPSNIFAGMASCGLAFDANGNVHMAANLSSGIRLTPSILSVGGNYDLVFNTSGTIVNVMRLPIDSTLTITQAIINQTSGAMYLKLGQLGGNDTTQAVCCIKNNSIVWIDSLGEYSGIGGIDYKGGDAIYVSLTAVRHPYSFGGLTGSNTTYPGPGNYYSAIIRLDTNGVGKWAYQLDGTTGVNYLKGITILPDGNVAAVGALVQTIRHGNDSLVAPASESINPYLLIVDISGNLVKLDQMHGGGYTDGGVAITSNKSGNLYLGGYYETTMTATGLGTGISSTGGTADFWLMKYGYPCNCPAPVAHFNAGTPSGKTVSYTYSGSTSGLDSLVWSFGDGGRQTVTSNFTAPVSHTFITNGRFNVCVTAYGSCGVNTYCQQTALSVSGMAALQGVSVYPNPAADVLTVEGAAGADFVLSNLVGQQVIQGRIHNAKEGINISALPSGSYLLQLTDKEGRRGVMMVQKQ